MGHDVGSVGGLGVLDFRKYYMTANLPNYVNFIGRHCRPDWVTLEAQASFPLAMDLILWIPQNIAGLY